LFNQFHQAGYLWPRPGICKRLKFIFRQALLQIFNHIKNFPPTVKDFPADRMVITACSAVVKCHLPAKSRASEPKLIFTFINRHYFEYSNNPDISGVSGF